MQEIDAMQAQEGLEAGVKQWQSLFTNKPKQACKRILSPDLAGSQSTGIHALTDPKTGKVVTDPGRMAAITAD
jgi:hypothetical protein